MTAEDLSSLLRTAVGLEKEREVGWVALTVAGSGPPSKRNILELAENPELASDGPADQVYLFDPWDIALGQRGEIYFTEYVGHRIRVLERDGTIRTLAGSMKGGYVDAQGSQARFKHPMGLALLPDGSLVIADTLNHSIRKITPQGAVTTLAGNGRPGFTDGKGTGATFRAPNGVATDPFGNVYVADTDNYSIRKIDPEGNTTTLAGSRRIGQNDGPALDARFFLPSGVCYDSRDDSLFITDMANNMIRKLTPDGFVTTLAGAKMRGHVDGSGLDARFYYPYGCDLDPQGRLWIADWLNQSVRVLEPDGSVATIAGRLPEAYVDGPAELAKLKGLMNVRVAPNGFIYLADTDNQRIRVLIP